ncbi:MAG: hypothetical protein ACRDDY_02750 [Clostridium sp.]|uniref:hypothetical protein n=1 Tax=Clostridium sp. TaxID=1506 RepID=UPI003EE5C534
MIGNVKISEVMQGLEEIKDIYGDKEVCILRIIDRGTERNLFVEFMDYSTHEIEVKTED